MPNIKGAAKRMRQAENARRRNINVKSRIKHARSKALAAGPADAAAEAVFRAYCSELDKAVKKGVIQKNTAVRRKARAANRLRKAAAAAPAASACETAASA